MFLRDIQAKSGMVGNYAFDGVSEVCFLLLNDIHRHFSCNFNYALLTRIVYYNNYSICIMLYIL